jgi:hypothetical protein
MDKMSNLVFVDCEARGTSPVNGTLAEFAAGHYTTSTVFHGKLFRSSPDPVNPAVPVIGERVNSDLAVAHDLAQWLQETLGSVRPVFVSDNPAYDWQWISGLFDRAGMGNPFGHSARRISDFWAGLNGDWNNTQEWKRFRVTAHDHNPVNDVLGNMEAFREIMARIPPSSPGPSPTP